MRNYKGIYREECVICKKWFDYEPVYCCDGVECSCQAKPLNPPVCSQRCADELSRRYIKRVENAFKQEKDFTS